MNYFDWTIIGLAAVGLALVIWFVVTRPVPVQAERTRDGKLEFAMRIKTLKR